MKKLALVIALTVPFSAMATDRHDHDHGKHKPVIINKTEVIDKTVTQYIDRTKTVQQVIDQTKTEKYYNTEYVDNSTYTTLYNENPFDDNRLTAGIAMSGIHYATPYKSSKDMFVSVSTNMYRGYNAFGMALQFLPAEDMAMFVDVRFTGGEYNSDGMIGAGASFAF